MSTENEGTEGPAGQSAPSAPPVPPSVPPAAPDSAPYAGHPGLGGHTAHAPSTPAATDAPTQQVPPVSPTQQLPPVPPGPVAPAAAVPPMPPAAGHGSGGWPPPAAPWGAAAPGAPAPASRPRGLANGLLAAVIGAALIAGGVGGGIGYWAAEHGDGGGVSTTVSAGDAPADFKREPGTVAAVANKALPSVVTIEAKSGVAQGQPEGGTGTGFVYDREGHILTNNHVVASAADGGELSATFSDGKKYDAEVVGRAQGYDVAVLKLKNAPSGLTPLALGNSDRVAVGDSTIAIGAPFGLSNTVTTGIISAKNRPVASGDGSSGKNSYMSALQTDASINPGNSGGPLLDASGAVIGINSAIQSAGGSGLGQSQAGSIGLGFAIPINQAKNVAEQLIKTGQPVYPVIGATVNMSDENGAVIAAQGAGGSAAVTPDGPAAKAGLKAGDVITKFNGKAVDSGPTLISEIWNHKPGDTVTVTYKRDGKESTVDLTLGERKGDG
ncbi:trypsin-like peptidase domain-containing protein [Streptomyces sp. SCSIO 30461]|uniref:S1C family serine protease n=1 Tax=Streptomyces sp. SCSIO 30461 TaxID=3118085 RepID=UPI0030CD90DB